jgi:CBS domain-containing protein
MVPEPASLAVDATAQEAGALLARPEVRAVFVCDGDRLTGVVTRKTLVREVVALGRNPGETPLGEIAEEPHYTIDWSEQLDDAFHFL